MSSGQRRDATNRLARGLHHQSTISSASPSEPENIKPGTSTGTTPTPIDGEKVDPSFPQDSSTESRIGGDFVIVHMDDFEDLKRPGAEAEAAAAAEKALTLTPPSYAGTIHSLHPISRILTISDLESCCALEEAAFPKLEERCSREKFIYRLTTAGELCLGLFTTSAHGSIPTTATSKYARTIETGRSDGGVAILMAHIVGTRIISEVVTDEAMDYPRDWKSGKSLSSTKGHQENGRTICLHSLAVDPYFQGKNIGRTLISAYIGMMNGAGIADRIALIAHEHMVPFYEKMKFVRKGPSKVEFGGGNWVDMVYDLYPHDPRARYG